MLNRPALWSGSGGDRMPLFLLAQLLDGWTARGGLWPRPVERERERRAREAKQNKQKCIRRMMARRCSEPASQQKWRYLYQEWAQIEESPQSLVLALCWLMAEIVCAFGLGCGHKTSETLLASCPVHRIGVEWKGRVWIGGDSSSFSWLCYYCNVTGRLRSWQMKI